MQDDSPLTPLTPPANSDISLEDINLLTPLSVEPPTTPYLKVKTPSEPSHSPHRDFDFQSPYSTQKYFRHTAVDRLNIHTGQVTPDILNSGQRILRSRKTLFMSAPDPTDSDTASAAHLEVEKDLERQNLLEQEIDLRPKLPGQQTQDKIAPTRYHFEYVYSHIFDPQIYPYVEQLEKWVNFNLKHNLYPDISQPIFDLDHTEAKDLQFSLTNLLVLNSDLIEKAQKADRKKRKQQSKSSTGNEETSPQTTKTSTKTTSHPSQGRTHPDPDSSGSSSDSFVVIPTRPTDPVDPHPSTPVHIPSIHIPSLPLPASTPTVTMPTDKNDKVPAFFPPDKFDGRNKTQTKQHWQIFRDFCDQHQLYFEDTDSDTATDIDKVGGYFKITLTDLARNWYDRNTFTSPKDLERKFLNDFSPYGKTSHQWLQQWNHLQFNPDTDNIDEFLEKFDDLAALVGAPDEFKLKAFRVLMPRDIVIAIRDMTSYADCAQAARDLMTILQNPITSKLSALSLLQSRSPSPKP